MITDNRIYHFVGELFLKKSHVLDVNARPKDDKVNWLFLRMGKRQFSFVYKIMRPLDAEYNKPFQVELAFTMVETAKKSINLGQKYEVLRGEEIIGAVTLIEVLD